MTPSEQPPSRYWIVLGNLTRHPLVLLLVGAVVSNMAVPLVMDELRGQERRLEIKRETIQQIHAGVAEIVSTATLIEEGVLSAKPEDSAKVFLKWSQSEAVINARLATYYHTSAKQVNQEWPQFARAVTNFYRLAIATTPQQRTLILGDLRTDLDANSDWPQLAEPSNRNSVNLQARQYRDLWNQLATRIYRKRDQLTRQLLEAAAQSG